MKAIFMQDYFCVIGATNQSATFPRKHIGRNNPAVFEKAPEVQVNQSS